MSRPVLPAIPVVVVSLGNVSEKCSLAALLWWRTTSASSVTFCGGVPAADCFPGVWQAEIDMKKATFTSTWLLFRSITG